MKAKSKNFDCVEMKNQAQVQLMREYESRKAEFDSYEDFILSTVDEDSEIAALRKKIKKSLKKQATPIKPRKSVV